MKGVIYKNTDQDVSFEMDDGEGVVHWAGTVREPVSQKQRKEEMHKSLRFPLGRIKVVG